MARHLRVEYIGAIYHVTARGNAQQDIFCDDGDRRLLYARFEECVPKYGVRLYLFCLMQNHTKAVGVTFGLWTFQFQGPSEWGEVAFRQATNQLREE